MYYICNVGKSYVPIQCDTLIKEAILKRNMFNAHDIYPNMPLRTGVLAKHATYEDFQRLFKCEPLEKDECNESGLQFPRSCSYPPCDLCTVDYISKSNEMQSKVFYK